MEHQDDDLNPYSEEEDNVQEQGKKKGEGEQKT